MKLDPNLQPFLAGSLLRLRPLLARDFEVLYSLAADPLIWEQHPEANRYERTVFEQFFAGALESRGAFVIEHARTALPIGSSRYYNLSTDKVSIGFTFLIRKYWGGIFNRELKTLMLEHAFRFATWVDFEIGENNLRSRRAIEKIGAWFVGVETLPTYRRVTYRLDEKTFRENLRPLNLET
jgi:RimJ/RimL family protein N-acetyltransferase